MHSNTQYGTASLNFMTPYQPSHNNKPIQNVSSLYLKFRITGTSIVFEDAVWVVPSGIGKLNWGTNDIDSRDRDVEPQDRRTDRISTLVP